MPVITTKSTVFALKKEVTEGVLVLPTTGADFVPPTEYPDLSPNIDLLTNNELRGSIGVAKSIAGPENPTASFGMYLKHSGVEGQAPNYSELIEGWFGSTSVQATERTTAAASTVSVIKLAAGGTDYARGKSILLKDGVNGFVMRPIDSVVGNDLTLGFALSAAPASGVACGKFVNFSPTNNNHPSVSVTRYSGNEHSIDAMSGGKVTNVSLSASAGELIEASFEMVGTKYFFDPIEITSSKRFIDFNVGAGPLSTSIAVKIYKTPQELASTLQAAMNSVASGITVVYSNTTGKYTIAKASGTLSLLWFSGANTVNTIGTKIGFTVAADNTASLSYVGANEISWVALPVSFDNADPLVAKSNVVLLGSSTDTLNFCAATLEITFDNTNAQVKCVGSETAIDSNFFSERSVTVSITGRLDKNDANLIDRFLNNSETKFLYNFGEKSGGNWVAGKCASIYMPTCTVSSFNMTDLDGVIGVEIELKSFVDGSGNGEIYLNYL